MDVTNGAINGPLITCPNKIVDQPSGGWISGHSI